MRFLIALLIPAMVWAANGPREPLRQFIEGAGGRNLLVNPGFENGRQDWNLVSPASTVGILNNSTVVGFGTRSLWFDSEGEGEHIETDEYEIPRGLWDRNCLARIHYNWSTGTSDEMELTVIDHAGNTLATTGLDPVSNYTETTASFVCPSEGSLKLRVGTADDKVDQPAIHVDGAYLGSNDKVVTINNSTVTLENNEPAVRVARLRWASTSASTCQMTRSSAAYGAMTGDADCDFTQETATEMGTIAVITDGSGETPGITWTPPKIGTYMVCMQGSISTGGAQNGSMRIREITNGTTIAEASLNHGTGERFFNSMCGPYTVSATSEVSIRMEAADDGAAGVSFTQARTASGVDGSALEMLIYPLSATGPQVVLANQASSPATAGVEVCSAYLNTTTPAVTRTDGSCVDAVDNDAGAGQIVWSFASTVFGSAPNCICTAESSSNYCSVPNVTKFQVHTTVKSNADSFVDDNAHLICVGGR